jgi:hypothetical protein
MKQNQYIALCFLTKTNFNMKTKLITAAILTSFSLFSQAIPSKVSVSIIKSLGRGVDISKASPNEQGLICYMDRLSDKDAQEFLKSFVDGEIVFKEKQDSTILVEEIKTGNDKNFFFEADNQHAMIVMGKWQGDSYFWSPISMGNKITEDAFRNDELFTGECIDRDSTGNLIAKYTFNNGKLISLLHFHKDGKIFQEYTFDNGIPNGISSEYDRQGTLEFRRTYKQGILSGPFYEIYYTDDPDCQKRLEEGIYSNGEKNIIKLVCY